MTREESFPWSKWDNCGNCSWEDLVNLQIGLTKSCFPGSVQVHPAPACGSACAPCACDCACGCACAPARPVLGCAWLRLRLCACAPTVTARALMRPVPVAARARVSVPVRPVPRACAHAAVCLLCRNGSRRTCQADAAHSHPRLLDRFFMHLTCLTSVVMSTLTCACLRLTQRTCVVRVCVCACVRCSCVRCAGEMQ